MFEFYLNSFYEYWGSSLYLILYLGCLLYIGRQKDILMKQIFVWPFLILLFTAYNPIVMEVVFGVFESWRDRYCRFFWVLPVQILCAYVLAVLIEKQKGKADRAVIGLLAVVIALMCGDTAMKVIPDETIYRIDKDIVEISKVLETEKDKENPIILVDEDIYYQIRQYNPMLIEALNNDEMNLYTGVKVKDMELSKQYESNSNAASMFARGAEIEAEIANAIFKERNVDFFVRNTENYTDEYIQSLDLEYIGTVEAYEVYRCRK